MTFLCCGFIKKNPVLEDFGKGSIMHTCLSKQPTDNGEQH